MCITMNQKARYIGAEWKDDIIRREFKKAGKVV